MKEINKRRSNSYINSISLEEATKNIYFEDVKFIMDGKPEQKFSTIIKKWYVYLASVFLPALMIISLIASGSKYLPQTIIAIVIELAIIGYMTYKFLSPYCNFLRYWGYEKTRYSLVKMAYISLFSIGYGMDEGSYIINFLVVTMCIITFLVLYEKVEENMIIEELNKRFNKQYKTSKTLNIMMKTSGLVVVVIFLAMQFYRINKWWLIDSVLPDSKTQANFFDDLIGIFIGIPILLLITLIPTYFLFNSKSYVEAKVINRYAEDFRERYDYTKKEWYEG
ncbi:hypothetical protein [Enterococcus sp. LJL51]|uniref:hypothetical protein n=1 Tax=Enterococcus sp. LJL51 TaxID=3416656 RepID=UPI003CF09DF2